MLTSQTIFYVFIFSVTYLENIYSHKNSIWVAHADTNSNQIFSSSQSTTSTCNTVTLISSSPAVKNVALLIYYSPQSNDVTSVYSRDGISQYPLSDFESPDNQFYPTQPYVSNLGVSFAAPEIDGYNCSSPKCAYNIYHSSAQYYFEYSSNASKAATGRTTVQVSVQNSCSKPAIPTFKPSKFTVGLPSSLTTSPTYIPMKSSIVPSRTRVTTAVPTADITSIPHSVPSLAPTVLPTAEYLSPRSFKPSNQLNNTASPTLALTTNSVSYTIYVQANLTDSSLTEVCSTTSTTPKPNCTLRAAWQLCLELIKSQIMDCQPASCSIILPSNSIQYIENITEQNYTPYGALSLQPTFSSNCPVQIEIAGETTAYTRNTSTVGDSRPVISGKQAMDQFLYFTGYGAGTTIQLFNLIIRNFGNGNQNGGAAYFGTANIVINNCEFTSNWGYGGGGALVASNYYSIAISKCTFSDNMSTGVAGEGIANNTNPATQMLGSNAGGALALMYGMRTIISNSVFINNKAANGGGAIALWHLDKGSVVLSNCTFESNIANGPGGAVIVSYCNNVTTISDCIFVKNSIYSNTDAGNEYPNYGGAFYIQNSPLVKIENCEFRYQIAYYGGAIYFLKSINTVIESSHFVSNIANGFGGSIYFYNSAYASLNDVTFSSNRGEIYGGAIYSFSSPSLQVSNAVFRNNIAYLSGGAVMVDTTSGARILNVSFFANVGTYGDGGALYSLNSPACEVFNSLFHSNNAENGGAISIYKSPNFDIRYGSFSFNTAALQAGAIGALYRLHDIVISI